MSKDAVKTLNQLIATSEDGHQGFAEAARKVEDTKLKVLFTERAGECQRAVGELQQCVKALGAEPQESGTITGAVHRGWAKLRASVSEPNLAVLEEAERGEDVAKAAYTKALEAPLPPQVRTVVERQHQGVLRNHDVIRDLRDRYRAAA